MPSNPHHHSYDLSVPFIFEGEQQNEKNPPEPGPAWDAGNETNHYQYPRSWTSNNNNHPRYTPTNYTNGQDSPLLLLRNRDHRARGGSEMHSISGPSWDMDNYETNTSNLFMMPPPLPQAPPLYEPPSYPSSISNLPSTTTASDSTNPMPLHRYRIHHTASDSHQLRERYRNRNPDGFRSSFTFSNYSSESTRGGAQARNEDIDNDHGQTQSQSQSGVLGHSDPSAFGGSNLRRDVNSVEPREGFCLHSAHHHQTNPLPHHHHQSLIPLGMVGTASDSPPYMNASRGIDKELKRDNQQRQYASDSMGTIHASGPSGPSASWLFDPMHPAPTPPIQRSRPFVTGRDDRGLSSIATLRRSPSWTAGGPGLGLGSGGFDFRLDSNQVLMQQRRQAYMNKTDHPLKDVLNLSEIQDWNVDPVELWQRRRGQLTRRSSGLPDPDEPEQQQLEELADGRRGPPASHPSLDLEDQGQVPRHQELEPFPANSYPTFEPPSSSASTSNLRRENQLQPNSPEDSDCSSSSESTNRKKAEKKTNISDVVRCKICSHPNVKLLIRGTVSELAIGREYDFTCKNCLPRSPAPPQQEVDSDDEDLDTGRGPRGGGGRKEKAGPGSDLLTLLNPTEAEEDLNDLMKSWKEGRQTEAQELAAERLEKDAPPLAPTRKKQDIGKVRKRNRPGEGEAGGEIVCDICLRSIANGSISAKDGKSSMPAQIEYVCLRCDERYKRCTDCGGGGGVRLGVGKWRSKEMFDEGKKNCRLSHARIGPSDEMVYKVFRRKDIPDYEVGEISRKCGELFLKTLTAGMAIPEVLETGLGMATSYKDILNMARDGWGLLEPSLTVDIEPTKQIRRYGALRWVRRRPRKLKSKGRYDIDEEMVEDNRHQPSFFVEKGMELAGFILAEWDMLTGSIFFQATIPWATGDLYEPTNRSIKDVLKLATTDRQKFVAGMADDEKKKFPEIKHCWTMLFFGRDSRVISYLQRKRGFLGLKEYLEKYPDADESFFAPIRDVYVPREYLRGWQIIVRRQEEQTEEDWERYEARHGQEELGELRRFKNRLPTAKLAKQGPSKSQ